MNQAEADGCFDAAVRVAREAGKVRYCVACGSALVPQSFYEWSGIHAYDSVIGTMWPTICMTIDTT